MALMSEKEAKKLGLYTRVSDMEPMLVENGELEDLAASILEGSAALSSILPDQTLSGLREMLRIVNSYYSNLIEGNSTHPIDIERATRKDYSGDPVKRNRQMESVAHIECQRAIDARLAADPEVAITSPEWLCWVHKCFY